ncbi:hypothetical protein CDV31_017137, partial [Fusarium ambrosium]
MAHFFVLSFLAFDPDRHIWLQNIKFELKKRFERDSRANDRKDTDIANGIRGVLMILGGSFQTVKLMAMRGIPWTQAWALMFMISIVFGEVLILLMRFLDFRNASIPTWRNPIGHRTSVILDCMAIIPIMLQIHLCL